MPGSVIHKDDSSLWVPGPAHNIPLQEVPEADAVAGLQGRVPLEASLLAGDRTIDSDARALVLP